MQVGLRIISRVFLNYLVLGSPRIPNQSPTGSCKSQHFCHLFLIWKAIISIDWSIKGTCCPFQNHLPFMWIFRQFMVSIQPINSHSLVFPTMFVERKSRTLASPGRAWGDSLNLVDLELSYKAIYRIKTKTQEQKRYEMFDVTKGTPTTLICNAMSLIVSCCSWTIFEDKRKTCAKCWLSMVNVGVSEN